MTENDEEAFEFTVKIQRGNSTDDRDTLKAKVTADTVEERLRESRTRPRQNERMGRRLPQHPTHQKTPTRRRPNHPRGDRTMNCQGCGTQTRGRSWCDMCRLERSYGLPDTTCVECGERDAGYALRCSHCADGGP